MKYPKINNTKIDSINQSRFNNLYGVLCEQIEFDNEENALKLTKSDIELLAYNNAVRIISQPY
jgi:hypothetical protein